MELIRCNTKDNFSMYGGLWVPPSQEIKKATKKDKKDVPKKVVIHVHGMTDYFYEGDLVHAIKNAALENDMAFFAFNNRGAGVVTLNKRSFYGTAFEVFEECIYDLDAAVAEMQKRGYREFYFSGHSTGCQKSVYFQSKRLRPDVKGIILLSAADDVGFQKVVLNKEFTPSIEFAKKLVKAGKGETIMPEKFKTAFFSANRYYNLYREDSIEGNIFDYSKEMKALEKIKCPILAIFGENEQYAAIPPKQMLEKIQKVATNSIVTTGIIPDGDHSFHGKEKRVETKISQWLKTVEVE